MIVAAAFCPHPPLLVPEVAQGAAGELTELRTACRAAITRAVRPGARIVVIGSAASRRGHEPTARGSLHGFGVDLEVGLGSDEPGPVELPLSLTVGAWLLRDALGVNSGAAGWSVSAGDSVPSLADEQPTVLLVMGDGSARRSTSAPGYLDDRAGAFDRATADALASGDPARLRLDVALGADLLAAGPPAWNAAAGLLGTRRYAAEILYDDAPYGVGYFVAVWSARD